MVGLRVNWMCQCSQARLCWHLLNFTPFQISIIQCVAGIVGAIDVGALILKLLSHRLSLWPHRVIYTEPSRSARMTGCSYMYVALLRLSSLLFLPIAMACQRCCCRYHDCSIDGHPGMRYTAISMVRIFTAVPQVIETPDPRTPIHE